MGNAEISRRSFLKGAGVAAVGAAALGAAGCASNAEGETSLGNTGATFEGMPESWEAEADFIILGTGGAGLSAAITAAKEELGTAIVLEASPEHFEGGNSRACWQLVCCPDSADELVKYQKALNGDYVVEDELLQAWANESVKTVEWLTDLGADMQETPYFAPEYPEVEGSSSVKTYFIDGHPGDAKCWEFLRDVASDFDIDIRYDSRGVELIHNPDTDEVYGIKTEDGRCFKAKKAVILGCGGFENNQEMLRSYFMAGFPYVGFQGTPYNRGDGLTMCERLGAQMWHTNTYTLDMCAVQYGDEQLQALDPAIVGSKPMVYRPSFSESDYIYVGMDGARFMYEEECALCRHGMVGMGGTHVTFRAPTPCWCIFGQKSYDASPEMVHESVTFGSGFFGMAGYGDELITNEDYINAGLMKKCDTIAELAAATGIDEAGLEYTINEYNGFVENQSDPKFHRGEPVYASFSMMEANDDDNKPVIEAFELSKIEPPFYALEYGTGLINTQGGAKRNANGQIIRNDNEPIGRLYGAGEFGSIFPFRYNGGGNFSESMSSGRIAVRHAATLDAWDAE